MPFRLVFRRMRRHWMVFLPVMVMVALAVAVVSSLFFVVDGLLFRPLPFPAPDTLIAVDFRSVRGGLPELAYSPEYADRRARLREALTFSPLVAAAAQADVAVYFDPREADGLGLVVQGVDARFFPLFGLSPALGRSFTPDDERGPPR